MTWETAQTEVAMVVARMPAWARDVHGAMLAECLADWEEAEVFWDAETAAEIEAFVVRRMNAWRGFDWGLLPPILDERPGEGDSDLAERECRAGGFFSPTRGSVVMHTCEACAPNSVCTRLEGLHTGCTRVKSAFSVCSLTT